MTDQNGLLYMRARYYSPELRRFINADIIAGEISNAVTLNRYAYANGNPVSNIDPFGLSAERGATTISPAPLHPTSIPYDILHQILELHNRKPLNFHYSEDYKNDAIVKVDENGNITYIFSNYYKGLLKESFKTTYYYFEVESAKSWQKQLDFKISDVSKLFDNKVVDGVNDILDLLTPPGGPFETLEFYAGLFQITTSGLAILLENQIVHNTDTSAYLFDKVISKASDEQVAILKSAVTYEGTKYKWQDSFNREKIAERILF